MYCECKFRSRNVKKIKNNEVISDFKYLSVVIDKYCFVSLNGPFNKYVTSEGCDKK